MEMPMSDSLPPKFADFSRRLEKEVVSKIVQATVPFYGVQDSLVVRDRSGIFLQIGAKYFILTAAHDLPEILENRIPLYVGRSQIDGIPCPIHDASFHVAVDEERVDVAVIRLSDEAAPHVLSSYTPIHLPDIARKRSTEPGLFLVSGYPQAWFDIRNTEAPSMALSFLAMSFSTPQILSWFDPKLHVMVNFNRQAIRASDRSEILLPPKDGIKGMSGCGIWRVADCTPEGLQSWRPEQCKLVAIEHTYHESQSWMCGTWIGEAMQILLRQFPELQPATKLVYR
jgi:hypothetical protein